MTQIPEELVAVVFCQDGMKRVLERDLKKKISRIGVDEGGHHKDKEVYTVHFKDDSPSAVYTEDQLAKTLGKWAGRKIINISLEQRSEFYVRFRI